MDICTLALEHSYTADNCDKGTLWIFNGDGRGDLDGCKSLDELAGWAKVAGPLQYDAAESIHGALKDFLSRNGIIVIDEDICMNR